MVGKLQLAAQLVAGFVQGNRMPLLHGEQRSPQPCRATAQNGHILLFAGRGKHPVQHMVIARVGVHRAEGTMTVVAQQARRQVFPLSCLNLIHVMLITNQSPGHRHTVGFPLRNKSVDELRIPEAAHRGDHRLNAPLFERLRKLEVIGVFLHKIVAVYMGEGTVPAPDLEDVHQALTQLAVCKPVLLGVAALLRGGDLHLDQEILPAGLLDALENFQGQRGALRHGLAAVFVRPLIEQRTERASQDAAPVAAVDGHAVKTQLLQFLTDAYKILDHPLQPLCGNAGLVEQILGVVPGHGDLIPVWSVGDIHVLRLNGHHGGGGQRAMLVDPVHDLPIVLHGLGIIHMAGGHFAVISLAVGIGTHTHADPGGAVSRQMLIEGAGDYGLLVVRGHTFGVQNPVFQRHIANLQR